MNLAFNTSGNTQTSGRTTRSVLLGKLKNTPGSTTRTFKSCKENSIGLNLNLNSFFKGSQESYIYFENYCILDPEPILLDNIKEELPEDSSGKKTILYGPFTPAQIKNAYSISNIIPLKNIRRPIVTIIAAFNNPYLKRDIEKFGKVFGLPPCNYTIHNFSRKFVTSWAVEVTLNVQWIYAINPYSQIRIILAASNSSRDMLNAIIFANNKKNFKPAIDTDIVSMSWGTEDIGNFDLYNNYFNNPNTIYIASSGNSNKVSFPSSSTNVLSIGGTSLNLNTSFNRVFEGVWSKSGCGYSKSFDKPFYQPILMENTNNKRMSPDFSCVGDPNTPCVVIINDKGYKIGGTSLSAPLYAGMLSLVTQSRLNNNRFTYTSVPNKYNSIQPLLYNNSNFFYDITQGISGIYSASSGYDIPSGNGVLNIADIIQQLG